MKIEINSKNFQNVLKKAIEKKPIVRLGKNSHEYFVPGSVGGLYRVSLSRGSFGEMFGNCECRGAERGFHCYHLAAALLAHSGFVRSGLRLPLASASLPPSLSYRGSEDVRNLI